MKNYIPKIFLAITAVLCSLPYITSAQEPYQTEMLQLVNNLRAQNNLKPLVLNSSLNQAAVDHSVEMATSNYFSHTGLNGSNFSDRIQQSGYQGNAVSENIAAGRNTAQATFEDWVGSPGHLSNMLHTTANEIGIGYASDNSADYIHYWTQKFGKGQVLSIEENKFINPIAQVYPNPFTDEIRIHNLNTSKNINISIADASGKIVFKNKNMPVQESISIPSSTLDRGIYFVIINNYETIKLMKTR